MVDARVAAVRADEIVGTDTDAEATRFNDEDLVDFLNDMQASTPAKAVQTMRSHERLMKGLSEQTLVSDDEPAQWYDHWEDGASREHRGMREDAEQEARRSY